MIASGIETVTSMTGQGFEVMIALSEHESTALQDFFLDRALPATDAIGVHRRALTLTPMVLKNGVRPKKRGA